MVTMREVEKQLADIGAAGKFRFWGRPEMLELRHILIPNEKIHVCMNGRYAGGFAMLCATDQRLLLIDKKLFHLSVEDLRYDMVAEVDFNSQLATASVKVCTPTKNLDFTTFHPRQLRELVSYIQQRVLEIRQSYSQQLPQPAQTFQVVAPVAPPAQQLQAPVAPLLTVAQAIDQPPQVENVPSLPVPGLRNPYTSSTLLMRRKIGRFGTIAAQSQNTG